MRLLRRIRGLFRSDLLPAPDRTAVRGPGRYYVRYWTRSAGLACLDTKGHDEWHKRVRNCVLQRGGHSL